jgi:HK97 family phage major capsid protein
MKSTINHLSALQIAAMLGPIHRQGIRFDITPLSEEAFQKKVFDQLDDQDTETEKLQKQLGDLTENYGNLQKETKTAVEELTKLKNTSGTLDEIKLSIQKVNLQMNREKRMAFGNPVERIIADDEKRARLNAAVRMGALRNNDLRSVAKQIIQGVMKDIGEDTSPGSTLITPDLAKDIYDTLQIYGAWNTLGVRRLGTKITNFPVKTVRADGGWLTTEGATITNDTAKAGTTKTCTAYPIAALLGVSLQLLQDAEFDVTADVMDDFSEVFNYYLDYASFIGNNVGDKTDAGQTGVFYGGTSITAATTHTTVETMTINDFMSVLLGVDPVVLTRAARWWMHPFMLTRMLGIKDTTGRPIFLTILERPAANAMGSILGYPVTFLNVAPTADTVSSKVAAFGDPQGQVVGIRQDFSFEYSDHAAWAEYERTFRGVGRAGTITRRAQAFGVLKTAAS